jgi:pimeloyl-ACP methyl ester carboxylesterase
VPCWLHRPRLKAPGPDGARYVSDDTAAIYRIVPTKGVGAWAADANKHFPYPPRLGIYKGWTVNPTNQEVRRAFRQGWNREQHRHRIHYRDHGSGKPIVLIHGYPLDGNSWERQEWALLQAGYRCISYDRRGFGQSSQPTTGYDYDTFAADTKAVLDHLALGEDVVLAGFSMGTGEVTRYIGKYGSSGVSKAVLFGVIPPFLLQTADNQKGVPSDVFEGIKQQVLADRYKWFDDFFANFYNTDVLAPERIGDAALRGSFQVAPARRRTRATRVSTHG